MRSKWTDGRLDDLAHRMDLGFQRVDEEIRALRAEMNARFDALHRDMLAMQRMMIGTMASMMVTIVSGFLITNL